MLRVLHVIEVYLPCKIHLQHVKRCSTTMAKLVDQLSRTSSTTAKTLRKIENSEKFKPKGVMYKWLKQPTLDWSLPEKIIKEISVLLENKK